MLRFRTFIIYLIISIGVTCYITAYVMKEFRFESCNMEIEHYKAKVTIIENENRILRAMSHSPQVVQPLASDVKEPIKQTRSIMPVSSPVQTPIVSDINKPSRQNKTITAHTGKVYAKKVFGGKAANNNSKEMYRHRPGDVEQRRISQCNKTIFRGHNKKS